MEIRFLLRSVAAGLATFACALQAQPTAHYPPGSHGLNCGSLPLPGFYLRDYNLFYGSERLNDPAGNQTGPANFQAFTYANSIRPIWIADVKVLGGYTGADVIVPFIYRHLRAGGYDNSTFGLGDIFAEASQSWHLKSFDISTGAGEWMPTGNSGAKPTTAPGLGFWTTMFTLGGTWFIDDKKRWSLSALNRYEINTEQRDTHTTTGNAWTLEWGAGGAISKNLSLAVVGYYQAKITGDTGAQPQPLNRVTAIGPEIAFTFPRQKLSVSFRYEYEIFSESRAQGNNGALVLTKRF
jgi:hypothetical protein